MNFLDRISTAFAAIAGRKATNGAPAIVDYDGPDGRSVRYSGRLSPESLALGASRNAAVMQCLSKLVLSYSDVRLVVRRTSDNGIARDQTFQALADQPNAEQTIEEAAQQIAVYLGLTGAAYGLITRNAVGQPVAVRFHPPGKIRAIAARDGRLVSHYEAPRANGDAIKIDAADVIALRWPILNPAAPIDPVAPLRQVAADIGVDDELTRYLSVLLENDAVVRTVVTDPKGSIVSETQRARTESKLQKEKTGRGRGRVTVLGGGLQINRIGLDLEELAFDALRRVPESRIAGAFLMSPVFAGLTAGLDQMTYDNFAGARLFFYEDTIAKLWRLMAAAWTRAIFPPDPITGAPGAFYFWPDLSDVIALRANEQKQAERVQLIFAGGIIDRAEARAALGYDVRPDDVGRFVGALDPGTSPTADPAIGPAPDPAAGGKSIAGILDVVTFDQIDAGRFFKGYNDRANRHAAAIAVPVASTFQRLAAEVVATIQDRTSKKDAITIDQLTADGPLFDAAAWRAEIAAAAGPAVESALVDQLIAAGADVGRDWPAIRSEFDDQIAAALDQSIDKVRTAINTVGENVRDQLAIVLKRNPLATPADFTRQILARFDFYTTFGANRIGRTTAAFATGAAQTTVYKGIGARYTWLDEQLLGRNHRHRHMRGQEPNAEGLFTNSITGSVGPHPGALSLARDSVNCMCVLRPRPRNS